MNCSGWLHKRRIERRATRTKSNTLFKPVTISCWSAALHNSIDTTQWGDWTRTRIMIGNGKTDDTRWVFLILQKVFFNAHTVWEHWNGYFCKIEAVQHRIEPEKTDSHPIKSAPYQAGSKAKKLEKQEIDRMLTVYVIEPAQTKWASPIVLVQKKDGTLRFLVDYSRLNAVMVQGSYSLLYIKECIDSLSGLKYF